MSAIVLKNFSFSYTPDVSVLANINLDIKQGEFVLLTGDIGSGKSTLLHNLVPALLPAGTQSGEAFAKNPTFVAQDPDAQIVFDDVLRELAFGMENRGVPLPEMQSRISQTLDFFGMNAWAQQKSCELSGGQKQILNLASVLICKSDVLLLDEPTSQLDPINTELFLEALRRVHREYEMTVLVATHHPRDFEAMANRVVHLQGGTLEEIDLSAALKPSSLPCFNSNSLEEGGKCAIHVENISYKYSADLPRVLSDLDCSFRSGKIFAIVGDNGCGKTTLLKTIAGILKPTRGKVNNSLKDSQAFLPQSPKLLFACDTVGEELGEWQASDVRARPVPELFADKIDVHPFDLSSGEQQLLALYKLLALKPKLLLLDEPVKGLDEASTVKIANLLREAANCKTTVIFATHNMEFAFCVADEIARLKDGNIERDIQ